MRTELLDYELPQDLIAKRPPERRDGGRLCIVERSAVRHAQVADLVSEIQPGDLVVLNRTKVRKARLLCERPRSQAGGGARVELLFLHQTPDGLWVALGKANRPLRKGDELVSPGLSLRVEERAEDGTLKVHAEGDLEVELERNGTMPIPPYMQRPGDEEDEGRYQTVFSEKIGSAAAPTASLHLTREMLARFQAERGASLGNVILHVGIGTFRPVTTEDLNQHKMHSESIEVGPDLVQQIEATRARGGKVVAIGTTVVRALESARDPQRPGYVRALSGDTDLLIQPGYRFSVVDRLLTNFHQPRSTLLALVSAFAGLKRTRNAYSKALEERYRFLSYGDAMWIPSPLGHDADID